MVCFPSLDLWLREWVCARRVDVFLSGDELG
jgi:hypothetical protein